MFISKISIKGFRCFSDSCEIPLNKGLTVLLGENGSGKSAIIDALRLLFWEDEYGRSSAITVNNFWRPSNADKNSPVSEKIRIDCEFSDLSESEQVKYLPWLNAHDPTRASLHLEIIYDKKSNKKIKRTIWAGDSKAGIFEWDTYNSIECNYLPPLRDAEERLRAIRGSRLSRLLTKLESKIERDKDSEGNPITLDQKVKVHNEQLLKDPLIQETNKRIRQRMFQALGEYLGQDIRILFAETKTEKILESLQLLFYPKYTANYESLSSDWFRELSENSLGYNNLIYLATILAELEDTDEDKDDTFRVLLIEEPEAHLHPQLQTRVLQYIQSQAEKGNMQVIVTTHSPTIAAAVSLDSIVVVTRTDIESVPKAVQLSKCGLDQHQKFLLERWLDVTKSTLLFARGVILVEGLAEALIIPELAKRVLKDHFLSKSQDPSKKEYTLVDFAVSVINMGGVLFKTFFQLFRGASKNDDSDKTGIPVRCAGIADCDPEKEAKPYEGNLCECKNHVVELANEFESKGNEYCRLFYNKKTLEYDLALESTHNLILMYDVLIEMLMESRIISELKYEKKIAEQCQTPQERADAAYKLLERTNHRKAEYAQRLAWRLAETNTEFSVPEYIKNAVLWACRLEAEE